MNNQIIFFPFLVATLISAILTPIFIFIFKKIGLTDDPENHKHPAILHTKPIPRGGGVPIFLGIFLTSIFFIPFSRETLALFIASFISLIVGLIDDKYDISPYLRFLANVIVAVIVVSSGINISFITNPLGGILQFNYITSFVVSLFWIVWVMNMLNWSKGVDGQMPGIVAISGVVIGMLSLRFPLSEQSTLIASNLSFAVAGAALGFLVFNFYPAKIFPGYGATSIYLLLAAVSMLSGAKLATAILVMGIPMIDGIFTIIRRILSGKSPFWHDKKHLHHLLLKLGLSQRKIALFYWIFSAILGAISLLLSSKEKFFVIVMLFVIVSGALIFLHSTLYSNEEENT